MFVLSIILAIAGLQPFDFFPKNEVSWLAGNGLRFGDYGQAYGTAPLEIEGAEQFTVELIASSFEGVRRSIDSLVSIESQTGTQFAIEIWTGDLVVAGWFRDRTSRTTVFTRLFCGGVFRSRNARVIVLTSGSQGFTVYVDGEAQRVFPNLILASRTFDGTLLLGQSAEGHQNWRGTIQGLLISERWLDAKAAHHDYEAWQKYDSARLVGRSQKECLFTFSERIRTAVQHEGNLCTDLTIPENFHPLRRRVLKLPTHEEITNISDIGLNLLGFLPLGCLFVWYLRLRGGFSIIRVVFITIMIGALSSLSIELLQVYLPSRDSSLLDLIINTLGTALGAAFGASSFPWLVRKQLLRQS